MLFSIPAEFHLLCNVNPWIMIPGILYYGKIYKSSTHIPTHTHTLDRHQHYSSEKVHNINWPRVKTLSEHKAYVTNSSSFRYFHCKEASKTILGNILEKSQK